MTRNAAAKPVADARPVAKARLVGSGLCAIGCVVLGLAGCSGGASPLPSLTTGSLFGKSDAKAAEKAADPMAPLPDTTVNRAMQVGMTSARATKCGFNFDAAAVKQKFLAAEARAGTQVEDLAKAEKVYTSSYNAVAKAASKRDGYCHDAKVKLIKADLAVMLAGDYAPQRLHPREEDDEGLIVSGTKFVME